MGNSANKSANLNGKDGKPVKENGKVVQKSRAKKKKSQKKVRKGFFRRSKTKGVVQSVKVEKELEITSYDLVTPEKEKDPDEYNLSRIRETLNKDLEVFLLNNVLMSVQFFENYEREVATIRVSPSTDEEIDRNIRLSEHQKHCVSPDKLHEVVSRKVRFRPQHGSKKHCSEFIHSPKLLVVQDNVELCEETDEEYNAVGPVYRLTMENADIPGYVKLRYDGKPRRTYDILVTNPKPEDILATNPKPEDEPNYSTVLGETPTPRGSDEATEPVEEKDTLTEGQKMMLDLQVQIEEGKKELSKSLNTLNVDVNTSQTGIYGTSKANVKRKFGPQSSSSEPMTMLNSETPTERRLSGIIKSTKPLPRFNAPPPSVKTQKQKQITAAKSMPDLSEGPPPGTQATRGSPQSDSSGYKSGSSSNRTNISLPNSRGSEVDYGYATIKSYATPKPLDQLRLGNIPANSSTIPEQCFTSVDIKVIDKDEEKIRSGNGTYIIPDKLFETRYYLKSTSFAASFADIFSEGLATFLGISPDTVDSATMQGSHIFYDTLEEGPNLIPLKIHNSVIPTITSTSWPTAAFEWVIRQRKCVTDTVRHVAYTWPTQRMVAKVKSFGCHVLPEGFMPTRGENPEHPLEWGLAFPEAERYLESCLSHAQARCFLFTLALYKNFMEPVNADLGLSTGNIRSVLLWQCEKNYAAWPEDRPGETLRKFLGILYEALMKESLPDYFVRNRNQLAGIPRTHIRRVQEKLCRVRENLMMHVLTMARNLRYVDEDNFYPRLDYQKLYAIVTTENIVALANPALAKSISQHPEQESEDDEDSDDSGTDMWAEVRKTDPGRQWIKKVIRQIDAEKAAQKLTNEFTRKSVDSIDLQIIPGQHPDRYRKQMILELLIPHFIAMAKRSNEFRAPKQSRLYIIHAERLTKLLGELTNNSSTVRKLMIEIKSLRQAGIVGIAELTSPQSVQSYTSKKSTFRLPESPSAKMPMDLPPIPGTSTNQTQSSLFGVPRTPTTRVEGLKRNVFIFPNETLEKSYVENEITTPDFDTVIEYSPSVILEEGDIDESTDF